jgi:hypothetical protein
MMFFKLICAGETNELNVERLKEIQAFRGREERWLRRERKAAVWA